MINFFIEDVDFEIEERIYQDWLTRCVGSEGYELGELNYILCSDAYLLELNQKFLDHDTFTDVISFDYSVGRCINGDIFISMERVDENATVYSDCLADELKRVMVHGILHFMGYKDKEEEELLMMRNKEDALLSLFHVEQ